MTNHIDDNRPPPRIWLNNNPAMMGYGFVSLTPHPHYPHEMAYVPEGSTVAVLSASTLHAIDGALVVHDKGGDVRDVMAEVLRYVRRHANGGTDE